MEKVPSHTGALLLRHHRPERVSVLSSTDTTHTAFLHRIHMNELVCVCTRVCVYVWHMLNDVKPVLYEPVGTTR